MEYAFPRCYAIANLKNYKLAIAFEPKSVTLIISSAIFLTPEKMSEP